MRLIHCKKCGAAIVTENALLERMNDVIHELNEKSRKTKNRYAANSYSREAASVTKMMKGIIHNTAQMEDRKTTCALELSEIVNYIRQRDLVSDEKLDELRTVARKKADERNKENQRNIDRIYGSFNRLYSPSNDPTANRAVKNTERKAGVENE